jgi:transposase-like protein
VSASRSSFAAFRFPPEVITVVRYGLSYHDIEESLTEWRIEVDHLTIYRRVQRVTPTAD